MKILLADDHALFRDGLGMVLNGLADTVQIMQAESFPATLQMASDHRDLDLILLDLNMPGMDGFSGLRALCHFMSATPVVVVSGSEVVEDVTRSIEAGAAGFIPKSSSSRTMIDALRSVLSGKVYTPPRAADAAPPADHPETGFESMDGDLTQRQIDVLQLLALGKSNKAIARELGLAEVTVKGHVTAILKILGVDNRTQAGIAASRLGLRSRNPS